MSQWWLDQIRKGDDLQMHAQKIQSVVLLRSLQNPKFGLVAGSHRRNRGDHHPNLWSLEAPQKLKPLNIDHPAPRTGISKANREGEPQLSRRCLNNLLSNLKLVMQMLKRLKTTAARTCERRSMMPKAAGRDVETALLPSGVSSAKIEDRIAV